MGTILLMGAGTGAPGGANEDARLLEDDSTERVMEDGVSVREVES